MHFFERLRLCFSSLVYSGLQFSGTPRIRALCLEYVARLPRIVGLLLLEFGISTGIKRSYRWRSFAGVDRTWNTPLNIAGLACTHDLPIPIVNMFTSFSVMMQSLLTCTHCSVASSSEITRRVLESSSKGHQNCGFPALGGQTISMRKKWKFQWFVHHMNSRISMLSSVLNELSMTCGNCNRSWYSEHHSVGSSDCRFRVEKYGEGTQSIEVAQEPRPDVRAYATRDEENSHHGSSRPVIVRRVCAEQLVMIQRMKLDPHCARYCASV